MRVHKRLYLMKTERQKVSPSLETKCAATVHPEGGCGYSPKNVKAVVATD